MKNENHYNDDLMIGEEEGHNVKRWLFRTLKMWPWFLLSLLLCIALTYLYLQITNPVYKSVASLMVKDETKGGDLIDDNRLKELGLTSNSKLVVNEIEILKSYDLMQVVVDSIQLFVSVKHDGVLRDVPVFDNEIPFSLKILNPENIKSKKRWQIVIDSGDIIFWHANKNRPHSSLNFGQVYQLDGLKFRIEKNPAFLQSSEGVSKNNKYVIDLTPRNLVVFQYSKNLLVEPANKLSTVINLELKDINSRRSTAVLHSLVATYNKQGMEKRNLEASNTINFLNDRLITVARDLKEVENTVEKFKSENKLTKLSTDAEQYLNAARQVDAQKAESETKLNIIKALEQDLLSNQDNRQTAAAAFGIQDASLENLLSRYNGLLQQKVKIAERSGPQNPLLLDVEGQIRELKSQLLNNVRKLRQAYTISLNDISRKDAQLGSLIQNVPQLERHLVQITRTQNVQDQLYSYLLQKREEATVSQASNVQDSQTVVEARSLGEISPKRNIIWVIAIFAGFMIPLSFFRIRDFMYNRVGDITQVEERANVPLLGIIAHIKKFSSPFVITSQSRSAIGEQLRHLRTSINYAIKGKDVKTILVTSFQPGDGKSFISLNLAACYALLKKKTVMLEFDLRKPHVAKDLNLAGNEGLSTILSGIGTIENLLVKVDDYDGYLYILPAGNPMSNPAELISNDRMPVLIKKLAERFEYIIINSPPIGIVTDANLLQKYSDITLMVLRQDHTSNVVYKELKKRIARHPHSPVYLVLNDVGKRKIYRGNYGYGSYAYNLGRGYYSEEK
jgi:tyrosine-protein kinase Etk/Wzc